MAQEGPPLLAPALMSPAPRATLDNFAELHPTAEAAEASPEPCRAMLELEQTEPTRAVMDVFDLTLENTVHV